MIQNRVISLKTTTVVDRVPPTRRIAKMVENLDSPLLAIISGVRAVADILTAKNNNKYQCLLNKDL
jgi:hypothetical protein